MNPLYLLNQCDNDIQAVITARFETEQEAADTLEAVIGQNESRLIQVAAGIKNEETITESLAERVKALQAVVKHRKEVAEKFRHCLAEHMNKYGIEKIETDDKTFKAYFSKSSAVVIEDEAQLPQEFIRVKTETTPNKTAIKKAISDGKEVAGAKLESRRNLILS